jgi:hypothetical protein
MDSFMKGFADELVKLGAKPLPSPSAVLRYLGTKGPTRQLRTGAAERAVDEMPYLAAIHRKGNKSNPYHWAHGRMSPQAKRKMKRVWAAGSTLQTPHKKTLVDDLLDYRDELEGMGGSRADLLAALRKGKHPEG